MEGGGAWAFLSRIDQRLAAMADKTAVLSREADDTAVSVAVSQIAAGFMDAIEAEKRGARFEVEKAKPRQHGANLLPAPATGKRPMSPEVRRQLDALKARLTGGHAPETPTLPAVEPVDGTEWMHG